MHTHNKHPCLEWDSNPRSERPSERRHFIPQTARQQWPALPRIISRKKSTRQRIWAAWTERRTWIIRFKSPVLIRLLDFDIHGNQHRSAHSDGKNMFVDSSVWQNTVPRTLLLMHAVGQINAGDCTYHADKLVVSWWRQHSRKQEFCHCPLRIIDSFMMQFLSGCKQLVDFHADSDPK
jgi:hypothetical protein